MNEAAPSPSDNTVVEEASKKTKHVCRVVEWWATIVEIAQNVIYSIQELDPSHSTRQGPS